MRTYTEQLQQLKENASKAIIGYADMLGEEDNGIKYITITNPLYKYQMPSGGKISKVGSVVMDDRKKRYMLYNLDLEILLDLADHITETSHIKIREAVDKYREKQK